MKLYLLIVLFAVSAVVPFAEDSGTAPADSTPTVQPMVDPWEQLTSTLMMLGMIVAVFYFLLIRPQQKQRQKHEERISQLKKGDQVVGAGGIFGTIIGMKDDRAVIKIAENVKIEILKSSITHVIEEEKK